MNCDAVFEVLTRGPFPTETPVDLAVERHLLACHECREMAEALRPAVSLFHESLSADETEGLPGYRGRIAPPVQLDAAVERMVATVLAEPAAEEKETESRQTVTKVSSRIVGSVWMIMAGVALSAFAIGLWCASSTFPTGAGETGKSRHEQARDSLRLTALTLPAACLDKPILSTAEPRTGGRSLRDLNCCRKCHVVPSESRPPLDALAAVTSSCSACH